MLSTSVTLLERVRVRNDQAAWDRFVALYAPLIYRWAIAAGLLHDDASDLTQEVFVVLVRELENFQYDHRQNFRGWLKTITIRKCRERQRRRHAVSCISLDLATIDGERDQGDLERLWEAEYQKHALGHDATA